jgi:hypothetical protein
MSSKFVIERLPEESSVEFCHRIMTELTCFNQLMPMCSEFTDPGTGHCNDTCKIKSDENIGYSTCPFKQIEHIAYETKKKFEKNFPNMGR